jgi:hypothetical protein
MVRSPPAFPCHVALCFISPWHLLFCFLVVCAWQHEQFDCHWPNFLMLCSCVSYDVMLLVSRLTKTLLRVNVSCMIVSYARPSILISWLAVGSASRRYLALIAQDGIWWNLLLL